MYIIDPFWEFEARQEKIRQAMRQRLLEREAANYRQQMRGNRPGPLARFLINLGDLMIAWGLKLKQISELRYELSSPSGLNPPHI